MNRLLRDHRDEDVPQSGTPGIVWNKASGAWMVRHKVKGRGIKGGWDYLGLYDDLDEAKRVKAAAVLERDYEDRSREDSTTHLSDAEIVEQFALDDECDAVWRERPLEGDEATIREHARWNSRHGGKKLDERAKFLGSRHMWAKDIVKRLAAIRDGGGDVETITPDCKQGDGLPQAGDYEAALAKAQAVENVLKREAQAKPLEGLIIPPAPINKGPLALVLMEAKRKYDLRQDELRVLAIGKDPFHQDTPMGHALGRWLMVRLDLHAPLRLIHLRGVHYLLVSVQAVKPDGQPYQNTKDDYWWLNDRVAKAARWLRYISFDRIVDERNEEAVISRAPRITAAISSATISTGYNGVVLPEPLSISRPEPHPRLSGFQLEQKYCSAAFGEKSSLSEVLVPFGQRHGADLFIAAGELSESRAYEMARDAVRDGRKLICFTFSDFDPSGMQMPVSIAVKLMAQQALQFPEFDFAVVPVALTIDDVIRLRLPTAMVEKRDKRQPKWQATFGRRLVEAGLLKEEDLLIDEDDSKPKKLAQVEIDALVAINPTELARMAEAAIAPYLDPTLARRAQEAKDAWMREAEPVLHGGVDGVLLDRLSRAEQRDAGSFNCLLQSLRRAKAALTRPRRR